MRLMVRHVFLAVIALLFANAAYAAGELHIFNWGDYTNPELVEKFEQMHDVKVTITDYDSNETALSKVRPGGHGFDIAVPTSTHMPIWIEEGLLMQTNPNEMSNFKHVAEQWKNPDWEPGRKYSVPWTWGSTGISVNTSMYGGDVNTSELFFNPPAELHGKINIVPEMGDVMSMAIMYHGGQPCTSDKEILMKVRDTLASAKETWKSIDYGTKEKLVSGDVAVSMNWNGYSKRAREENPDIVYGYPIQGYPLWMDNVVVLADAKNVENAKLFQNFLMAPENAAMISAFAQYANGIAGSEAHMPEDLASAREIAIPEELQSAGVFIPPCPPEAQQLYTAIWTEVQK